MSSLSLLPQSESLSLKSIDKVYEKTINKLNEELQVISTLAQPKMADEKFLPYLAHTYQVDFWSNDLSSDEKRAIIDSSILLHRKKGTLFALKEVLKRLNIDIKFYEWFEYEGLPYHFKIDLDFISRPAGKNELKIIEDFINIYKNEKSILEIINIKLKTNINEKMAAVTIIGEDIEVVPYVVKHLSSEINGKIIAVSILSEQLELKPFVVKDFIFINKERTGAITVISEKIEILPIVVRNLFFHNKENQSLATKLSEQITSNLTIGEL